jgi:hypothetical protein
VALVLGFRGRRRERTGGGGCGCCGLCCAGSPLVGWGKVGVGESGMVLGILW